MPKAPTPAAKPPAGAIATLVAAHPADAALASTIVTYVDRVLAAVCAGGAGSEDTFLRLFRVISSLPKYRGVDGPSHLDELVAVLFKHSGVHADANWFDAANEAHVARLKLTFSIASPLAHRWRSAVSRPHKKPAAAGAGAAATPAAAAPVDAATPAADGTSNRRWRCGSVIPP